MTQRIVKRRRAAHQIKMVIGAREMKMLNTLASCRIVMVDGKPHIYTRNYNVRLASFSPGTTVLPKYLGEAFDLANEWMVDTFQPKKGRRA